MTVVLKHPFNSSKADGTDSTLVQPSNWNAAHTLTATAGNVLGTPVGSTTVTELPLAFDASLQSMIPPTGTTAQRPASPTAGMLRYNSTTSKFELYNGTAWGSVGGGAAVSSSAPSNASTGDLWYDTTNALLKYYDGSAWQVASASNTTIQLFSGNASTTVFTLSAAPSSKNVTSIFISGVYQAKGTYSLSGTSLTFSTAPPTGTNNIEVNWTNSVPIGIPGDGTVTAIKVAEGSGSLRSIPQNVQTGAYVLAVTDNGKHISTIAGGITVPANVFGIGDTVTIYNNSNSNQTITQGSSVTLRQSGTANTGNRTLAQYGLCTVLCVNTNVFVITGAGVS